MKEILVATTKSTYDQYKNKIDTENVVTFGIIFIFLFALLWFTLALRRKNGVKRKTWKPFQNNPIIPLMFLLVREVEDIQKILLKKEDPIEDIFK